MIYFFTATCLWWKKLLNDKTAQEVILQSFSFFAKNEGYQFYAFVIMPNHIHVLIELPHENKANFKHRFMMHTARTIIIQMKENKNPMLKQLESDHAHRQHQFWERNSKWILVPSIHSFHRIKRYIHHNPLQAHWKLSSCPEDYVLSSAKSYTIEYPLFDFLTLKA